MSTSTVERTTGRTLVGPDLFHRLADRLVIDEDLDRSLAERIVDQALAFLKACADHPGRGLAPSQLVDLGWHAFVLHTRDYAAFCDAVAGRFIHHVPTEGHRPGDDPQQVLDTTVAAIRDAGMVVDTELWQISSGPQDPHRSVTSVTRAATTAHDRLGFVAACGAAGSGGRVLRHGEKG